MHKVKVPVTWFNLMSAKFDFTWKVRNESRFLTGSYSSNTIFKPDHGRTSNNNVTGINYCVNIDETPTDETPCVSNVPFWFHSHDLSGTLACDPDKVLKTCHHFLPRYNVVLWLSSQVLKWENFLPYQRIRKEVLSAFNLTQSPPTKCIKKIFRIKLDAPISTKAKSSVKVRIFVTQLFILNLRKQTFLCLNCFFPFFRRGARHVLLQFL